MCIPGMERARRVQDVQAQVADRRPAARALLAAVLGMSLAQMACSEAQFRLAAESRRPRWFEHVECERCTVDMNLYVRASGRWADFTLKDEAGRVRRSVTGKLRGDEPLRPSGGSRPSYEVVEFAGTTDVVEFRGFEPVFYLLDDPSVFRLLGVER